MEYITHSKDSDFYIDMFLAKGSGCDNADAMAKRFMITLITKGTGIANIDDRSIPYIAPCVFCINEREHLVLAESGNNESMTIYFAPAAINSALDFDNIRKLPDDSSLTMMQDVDMLKSFLERNDRFCGKYSVGTMSQKRLMSLFNKIEGILQDQGLNWPCKSRSFLFEILFFLNNLFENGYTTEEACFDETNDDLNAIVLYFYENYGNKITIQELLDRFHMSKSTLAKLFRDNLNESCLSYLNRLRISIAETMLRDTLLPVSEIMSRVGFNDNVHFLRTFKKHTGISPSEYREKYNWM